MRFVLDLFLTRFLALGGLRHIVNLPCFKHHRSQPLSIRLHVTPKESGLVLPSTGGRHIYNWRMTSRRYPSMAVWMPKPAFQRLETVCQFGFS